MRGGGVAVQRHENVCSGGGGVGLNFLVRGRNSHQESDFEGSLT